MAGGAQAAADAGGGGAAPMELVAQQQLGDAEQCSQRDAAARDCGAGSGGGGEDAKPGLTGLLGK